MLEMGCLAVKLAKIHRQTIFYTATLIDGVAAKIWTAQVTI
jgi:hypothetical protein